MPKNVLVIDDDSAVAESTELWLKGSGYQTSIASDGRSGLAAVQNSPPDLIILDIDMPGLDGFEVHRQLKASKRCSAIPVVFQSGNNEPSTRKKAIASGCVAFVAKPFNGPDLLTAVRLGLNKGMHS